MSNDTFRALIVDETEDGVAISFQDRPNTDLPEGDVTVRVEYSSLNYKDGMVLGGIGRLVRNYPHIPGIDLVGQVEDSSHPDFDSGDRVILTGWRVGEAHWGGYATRARVKGDWLVKLPDGLSAVRAMAIGTAGLTAMLAVMSLEEHGLTPESEGEVLVTGAAGGVGSVAVSILAALGYRVAAGTGREETHAYLKDLGAHSIISREALEEAPRGPLNKENWAAAIDAVGGPILANLLAGMRYGGSCAAIGLAASPSLKTTVLPFLLRGVNLLGIDSVQCPTNRRQIAWTRLMKTLPMDHLDSMTSIHGLQDLEQLGADILAGKVRGRVVIDVNA